MFEFSCGDEGDFTNVVVGSDNAGSGGPQFVCRHNSPSPAISDYVGGVYFNGENSSAGNEWYGGVNGIILDETATTEDTDMGFYFVRAGSNSNHWFIGSNGLYSTNASGSGKGHGTVNADAVYDDNSLLTCYVDEAVKTGQVDFAKWDGLNTPDEHFELVPNRSGKIRKDDGKIVEHTPARMFARRLGTEYDPTKLAGQKKHLADKKHMTPYPNPDKYDESNRPSIGGWVQRGIEMDELLFQYIVELESRVAALEN
jgi:hypothetical protein